MGLLRRKHDNAKLNYAISGNLDFVAYADLVSNCDQNIARHIVARLFEAAPVLGWTTSEDASAW